MAATTISYPLKYRFSILAKYSDGSWLDGRGMLHLVPALGTPQMRTNEATTLNTNFLLKCQCRSSQKYIHSKAHHKTELNWFSAFWLQPTWKLSAVPLLGTFSATQRLQEDKETPNKEISFNTLQIYTKSYTSHVRLAEHGSVPRNRKKRKNILAHTVTARKAHRQVSQPHQPHSCNDKKN